MVRCFAALDSVVVGSGSALFEAAALLLVVPEMQLLQHSPSQRHRSSFR